MTRALLFVLPLLLLVGGTSVAQTVRYDVDRQADFSTFKTYRWEVRGGSAVDELQEKQIRAAIDRQLALKGLVLVTGDTADLYVTSQTIIGRERGASVHSTVANCCYGPGWGWSYGVGGWFGGPTGWWTVGETTTISVREITIDIHTATQGGLVWRGVVSKTLNDDAKPGKQQKALDKSLRKLFENYPPRIDS